MIAIVNISREHKVGMQVYEVRINRCVIAVFEHEYKKGLASCLLAASKAVKEQAKLDLNMLEYALLRMP